MDKFLQHYCVYLTPITPIHIGCGEDFEPTNYVMDNGVLYHFDPSRLGLSTDKRSELSKLAESADLGKIQKFFQRHQDLAKTNAHYFAHVAAGVFHDWQHKIGKPANIEGNGQKVFSQFAIERTAYLAYYNEPYIPGSGFKGALATAILDKKHQENGNVKLPDITRKENKNLGKHLAKEYIGEFQNSLLRQVKFSDFIPTQSISTQIYYSMNVKKKLNEKSQNTRRISLRRECILGGQYRSFKSELALMEQKNHLANYLDDLHKFNLNIFQAEMKLLQERKLISVNDVKSLIGIVINSKAILVRLGKSGAESKSLRGNGVAQITIMKGKGQKPDYRDHATTIWLASPSSNATANLLPFGWAILEFEPRGDNEMLKAWCEQQEKPQFDKRKIIADREAKQAELRAQKAERLAKLEAEKQAEQAKQALIDSASENQKVVLLLVEKFRASRERQVDTNSPLLKEAKDLVTNAIETWQAEDKQFAFAQITIDLIKERIDLKKKNAEKDLQKLLDKLSV